MGSMAPAAHMQASSKHMRHVMLMRTSSAPRCTAVRQAVGSKGPISGAPNVPSQNGQPLTKWTPPTDLFVTDKERQSLRSTSGSGRQPFSDDTHETVTIKNPDGSESTWSKLYCDAIFEGGGVKGFAFLGALQCFADYGIFFRKVAGTSAGSITAAALATNDTTLEANSFIQETMADLSFLQFLDKQIVDPNNTVPIAVLSIAAAIMLFWGAFSGRPVFFGYMLALDGFLATGVWALYHLRLSDNPADYLDKPASMAAVATLSRKTGLYSTSVFKEWLDKTFTHGRTFQGLTWHPPDDGHNWWTHRELKVITSDISTQQMRVLPDELKAAYGIEPESFHIAEAARQSMSIPLFFEAATQPHCGSPPGVSTVVDGGVLSNFPVWIFDVERRKENKGARPKCPTIGLQLTEITEDQKSVDPLTSLPGVLISMINAAIDNASRVPQTNAQFFSSRTISIPIRSDIKTTDFDLSDEKKTWLYRSGYESAKNFLSTFENGKILAARGFAL